MFFQKHRKEEVQKDWKERGLVPAIRSSICTGEKTVGFKNPKTGAFEDVGVIRSDADLEEFRRRYGVEGKIETFY
ncbi:MAG: aspartate dehydrogenase [Lachnospiraceae bacterium]|jgi:hypothetical protein